MRLAVLIIGLCLVMLVGMQSCTVMVGGGIADNKDLSGGGAIGVFVSFLFILGSAFVMGYPKASMIIFLIASFLKVPTKVYPYQKKIIKMQNVIKKHFSV